ncbi:MAG: hypothetical protein IT454_19525 [Planctomycetes bacterium]|nr:hypothetical protein [Planctomycetota bacterium]
MSRERYVPLFSSIRGSNKLAKLSDDTARMFWFFLLAQCDGWGRIDARPAMLNAEVWPLLGKSADDVRHCVEALEAVGLVERHSDGEREWLQLPDWEEKAGTVGKADHRRQSAFPDSTDETRQETGRAEPSTGQSRANAGPTLGQSLATEGQDRATSHARARKPEPEPENEPEIQSVAADARRRRGSTATQAWDRAWTERRTTPFAWTRAHAIALERHFGGPSCRGNLPELERRIAAFLDTDDAFLRKRCTPSQLVASWHQFDPEQSARPPTRSKAAAANDAATAHTRAVLAALGGAEIDGAQHGEPREVDAIVVESGRVA